MGKFNSIGQWCKRYLSIPLGVAIAYILFVLFFNDNSYAHSADLQKQIDDLEVEIKENQDSMQYYHDLNRKLATDPATLERIVREQYHMQRFDEDVYIVVD